jgi:hypothetical protein
MAFTTPPSAMVLTNGTKLDFAKRSETFEMQTSVD